MICIAGGSGMSAVNAIVEEAIHQKVKRNCYFFYGARTQNDLYLVDELTKIAEQWDKDFKFDLFFSVIFRSFFCFIANLIY